MGKIDMFNMNGDVETRDRFLFGEYNKEAYECGGVREFSGISLKDIDFLMENNFLDPEDSPGVFPTAKDIRDFIAKNPEYSAFGYAVSPERRDYGITLNGIERKDGKITDINELKTFVEFARDADEFDMDGYACWD